MYAQCPITENAFYFWVASVTSCHSSCWQFLSCIEICIIKTAFFFFTSNDNLLLCFGVGLKDSKISALWVHGDTDGSVDVWQFLQTDPFIHCSSIRVATHLHTDLCGYQEAWKAIHLNNVLKIKTFQDKFSVPRILSIHIKSMSSLFLTLYTWHTITWINYHSNKKY